MTGGPDITGTPGTPEPLLPVFDTDVLRRFESLGDNCEFGLVQSGIGVDQLGFFRFNNTGFGSLLRALDTGFRDFEDPKDIRLEVAVNNELIVHLPDYDLRYHTFHQAGSVDEDALIARQRTFLSFLARKCLDDLKTGRKIFLRKDGADRTQADMICLLEALQRHGPNRLFWVSEAPDRDPPVLAEPVAPGLVHGFMDVFSTYEDARTFSFRWFGLCRQALHLLTGSAMSPLPAGPQDPAQLPEGSILRNVIVDGGTGAVLPPRDLPEGRTLVRLPAAFSLMGDGDIPPGDLFDPAAFAAFRTNLPGGATPVLLFRDRSDFSFLTSLDGRVSPRIPRLRLPPDAAAFVGQLFLPHGLTAA